MTLNDMSDEIHWTDDVTEDFGSISTPDVDSRNLTILSGLNDVMFRRLAPAIAVFVAIMVVGVAGNVLICYIFIAKLRKSGQNFLLLCLGFFDLLSSCIGIPSEIFDMRNYYYYRSAESCKAMRFLTTFPSLGSILLLLVIGADRYRKICKPLNHQIHLFHTRIALVIIIIVAVVLSVPALYIYGHRTVPTPIPSVYGQDCSVDDKYKDRAYPIIYEAVFGACFVLCTVSLVTIYVRIWLETRRHFQYMKTHATFGSSLLDETATSSANYDSVETITDSVSRAGSKSSSRKSSNKKGSRSRWRKARRKSGSKYSSKSRDGVERRSNANSENTVSLLKDSELNPQNLNGVNRKVGGANKDTGNDTLGRKELRRSKVSFSSLILTAADSENGDIASKEVTPSDTHSIETVPDDMRFGSINGEPNQITDSNKALKGNMGSSKIDQHLSGVGNLQSDTENSAGNGIKSRTSSQRSHNNDTPEIKVDNGELKNSRSDQSCASSGNDDSTHSVNNMNEVKPQFRQTSDPELGAKAKDLDETDRSLAPLHLMRRSSMQKAMGVYPDTGLGGTSSLGFTFGVNNELGQSQYLSDSDDEFPAKPALSELRNSRSKGEPEDDVNSSPSASKPQSYRCNELTEQEINSTSVVDDHNALARKSHIQSDSPVPSIKVYRSTPTQSNRISFADMSEDDVESIGTVEGAQSLSVSQSNLERTNEQRAFLKHSKSTQSLTTKTARKALKARRTTIIACVITTGFILSYLPHLILIILRAVKTNFEHDLRDVPLNFYNIFLRSYFVNNVINIFVYGTMNLEFRTQIVQIWGKIKSPCKKR